MLRVQGVFREPGLAELARRVGRNPASIRRLFTAEQVRPELPLIISIANALDANVEIKASSRRSTGKRRERDTAVA